MPNKKPQKYIPTTSNNYKSKVVIDRNDAVKDETDGKTEQELLSHRNRMQLIADRDFTDMAENVFDTLKELRDEANAPTTGEAAMSWMRNTIRALHEIADIAVEEKFIRDEKRLVSKKAFKRVGQMFMFNYQPITRTKLPYYDTFPLIFILRLDNDGFLGINLHYLPMNLRVVLFKMLMKFKTGNVESKNTRLVLIYEYLMRQPKFRHYIKPCIKKYLYNRIDSYILRIPPEDWYIAVFLPLARFRKKHRTKVWEETRRKIVEDRLHSDRRNEKRNL